MPFSVLRDRIAVILLEDPSREGSIYIPEEAKQKPDQGIVYEVGSEVEELEVGDHVIFGGYVGQLLIVPDEGEFAVMRESAVVAVIEDAEPDPVLTNSQVHAMIDDVIGTLVQKGTIDSEVQFALSDELHSRVDSLIFAEGLRF